jgi:hypothetical protein
MTRARALIFAALPFVLMGCGEEQPKNSFVLKEAIQVKGTCSEDHADKSDSYAGQIVRWQTVETGEVLTYGFVIRVGGPQRILDEATHPNVYHTPSTISFTQIDIDTNQPKWALHGVSVRGDDGSKSNGYNSTCEVEVLDRGSKVWDVDDILKAQGLKKGE